MCVWGGGGEGQGQGVLLSEFKSVLLVFCYNCSSFLHSARIEMCLLNDWEKYKNKQRLKLASFIKLYLQSYFKIGFFKPTLKGANGIGQMFILVKDNLWLLFLYKPLNYCSITIHILNTIVRFSIHRIELILTCHNCETIWQITSNGVIKKR